MTPRPRTGPPAAVIVGTGRSGTGYIAELLTSAGVKCGHENHWTVDNARRRPVPIDASWLAVGRDDLPPLVLAQYRDPLAVVSSLIANPEHGPWVTERERLCGPLSGDPVADAMRVVATWGEAIADHRPQMAWRVEHMEPATLVGIALVLGHDVEHSTAVQAWCRVGTQTNTHGTTRKVRVSDLPATPDRRKVLALREAWGYWP